MISTISVVQVVASVLRDTAGVESFFGNWRLGGEMNDKDMEPEPFSVKSSAFEEAANIWLGFWVVLRGVSMPEYGTAKQCSLPQRSELKEKLPKADVLVSATVGSNHSQDYSRNLCCQRFFKEVHRKKGCYTYHEMHIFKARTGSRESSIHRDNGDWTQKPRWPIKVLKSAWKQVRLN